MVKVHAPLASQDAAGRLAGTLVFQHHKRGISLKKLTKPKQPRTALQHNTRALVKRLGHWWNYTPKSDYADWHAYGLTIGKDAYRAYMHLNLMRWQRNAAPTSLYPGLEGQYTAEFSNWATVAQGRRIAWSFDLDVYHFDRHVILWAQTVSGEPATFLHVEQIELAEAVQTYSYLTRPLPPAFYRCWIKLVDRNGKHSVISMMQTVTIN